MHYIDLPTFVGFIQNLGPWEIGLIILLALLLFGGRKLPELARGAGKAIKEFRSASQDAEKTFKDAMNQDEKHRQNTDAELAKPFKEDEKVTSSDVKPASKSTRQS